MKFMKSIFKDGDAEKADKQPESGNTWYISHQEVYHLRKPDEIRVGFDCSAKYESTALNDHLQTGPNHTNALTGVLCQFCIHPL